METFFNDTSLWLFLGGIPIGMYAFMIGGAMFLSIPFFQLLFPEFTMGALLGNIRIGSAIRTISGSWSLRKHIHYKASVKTVIPLCIGALLGAFGVASISQSFVLPAILVAIVLSENAKWISDHLSQKHIFLITLLLGIFGGILGAGIGLILLALSRIQIPDDTKIVDVRANAVFMELFLHWFAVIAFFIQGVMMPEIWVPWAAGSFTGGLIGGTLVQYTGKLPARGQRILLRIVFVFAIGVAVWRIM